MDFEQVVRERRSIRKFLDKPVEASALNAVSGVVAVGGGAMGCGAGG